MNPFYAQFLWHPSMRYSLAFVIILLLHSCKKDNEALFPYPSVFQATRTNITSEVRLFTKQGEVKSQAVIADFINRYNKTWAFAAPISGAVLFKDTIQILARDQVQLGSSTINFHLQFHDNLLYFVPQDTATIQISYIYDLSVAIEKFKPIFEKRETIPSTTGMKSIAHSVIGNYATFTSSQLTFPMVSFLVAQSPGNYYTAKYNNSFDPTGYKALNTGDTLAIQESVVVYEK